MVDIYCIRQFWSFDLGSSVTTIYEVTLVDEMQFDAVKKGTCSRTAAGAALQPKEPVQHGRQSVSNIRMSR